MTPWRSKAPSPQSRRRWTVSSNRGSGLLGVGVVELDADDVLQRHFGEVGRRGVGALGVPHVDDQATGRVTGGPDQVESDVDVRDVRPGQEFQADPGAGVGRLGGEAGELGGPVVAVPGPVGDIGAGLEVAGAERLGGGEEVAAHPGVLRVGGPPAGDQLELEVGDAVVVEQRPQAPDAVGVQRGHEVGVQQAEAAEPGGGGGLDAVADGDRAALVAGERVRVAGGGPAGREQGFGGQALVGPGSTGPGFVGLGLVGPGLVGRGSVGHGGFLAAARVPSSLGAGGRPAGGRKPAKSPQPVDR